MGLQQTDLLLIPERAQVDLGYKTRPSSPLRRSATRGLRLRKSLRRRTSVHRAAVYGQASICPSTDRPISHLRIVPRLPRRVTHTDRS
jgi:hypothetical protein